MNCEECLYWEGSTSGEYGECNNEKVCGVGFGSSLKMINSYEDILISKDFGCIYHEELRE